MESSIKKIDFLYRPAGAQIIESSRALIICTFIFVSDLESCRRVIKRCKKKGATTTQYSFSISFGRFLENEWQQTNIPT